MTPKPIYQLTDRFKVAADAGRVWEFFSTAANLPRITPPWLAFTVDTPEPIVLGKDSIIEYTIRWMKLPMHWRTRITEWQPPTKFVDLQEKGPYALWHHTHTFEPTDGGVICSDRVLYRLPLDPLGRFANPIIVKPQLRGIFRYRREVIGRELGGITPLQDDVLIEKYRATE